ncbi:MAG: hypothetical protein ABIS03_08380 [Gemmatimonadaceae bacterium]
MTFSPPVVRCGLAPVIGAILLLGCASAQPSTAGDSAGPANPLSGLVSRQILVLPTQFLAVPSASGAWDIIPEAHSALPILDEEIEEAFKRQGVRRNWTFAPEIVQSADRNGGLAGNPRELGAAGIRRIKAGDTPLPEALGSQIRKIAALTSARYVLVPLEVHVDARGGERKGSVRILLIDSRTARVTWVGDVDATPSREPQIVAEALSPYGFRLLARDLAARFAEMVVAQ